VPRVRGLVACGGQRRGDVGPGFGDAGQGHLREAGRVGPQPRHRPASQVFLDAGEEFGRGVVAVPQED
jgi:hypothetical protein